MKARGELDRKNNINTQMKKQTKKITLTGKKHIRRQSNTKEKS